MADAYPKNQLELARFMLSHVETLIEWTKKGSTQLHIRIGFETIANARALISHDDMYRYVRKGVPRKEYNILQDLILYLSMRAETDPRQYLPWMHDLRTSYTTLVRIMEAEQPKMVPILEAWAHDADALALLVKEHARITVEGFRPTDEHPRVEVKTFLGGLSPITGLDYGSNTYIVLYKEEA